MMFTAEEFFYAHNTDEYHFVVQRSYDATYVGILWDSDNCGHAEVLPPSSSTWPDILDRLIESTGVSR